MNFFSFLAGFVFTIGLTVSGMINPEKVKGFLNILGEWDYSLAFVMGGAVVFNFIAFKLLIKKKPIFANSHYLPTKLVVDRDLIIGAVLFGVGWGLVGICPGPAIVNLVTMDKDIFIFMAAMVTGMYLYELFRKLRK